MLTEAMVAVAAAGGAAVVQAAGTDAWQGLRQRVAALLGRGEPQLEQAELDRLDRTAATLAQPAGQDTGPAGVEQATVWQARFEALLESLDEPARAQAAAELQALIKEIGGTAGGGSVSGNTFFGPTAFQTGDHNRQDNRFGT
jgi:hypothetical protein